MSNLREFPPASKRPISLSRCHEDQELPELLLGASFLLHNFNLSIFVKGQDFLSLGFCSEGEYAVDFRMKFSLPADRYHEFEFGWSHRF
jgi:hypothetical protein